MSTLPPYWELRRMVKDIIPRRGQFLELEKRKGMVEEKGRKTSYYQFNLQSGEMISLQRLLKKDEMTSFLEVSLRAPHCPMPLNGDVWDALRCGFGCRYCYADSFRASLYTSFFDNSKNLGMRYCKPDYFRPKLDKLMKFRGDKGKGSEIQRAIGLEIPIRLGIRFEDFLPVEKRLGISLDFLKYLAEVSYPVMINTKSALVGQENYVRVLTDNKAKAAVHITLISADDRVLKSLEPGAPSFKERVQACKNLTDAGIRVVGRIEPFMVFVNDEYERVVEWVQTMKEAGVKNITLDTYSRSAISPGIVRQVEVAGWDFNRMFMLMSDAQWLGSLLLSSFMDYLRQEGFSCSTFDFGNVPDNDQWICCEVGDWFTRAGEPLASFGNTVMAIRYIKSLEGKWVSWDMYESFVEEHGGWLSDALRQTVYEAWNLFGNNAYFPDWAQGIELYGVDRYGHKVYRFNKSGDFRTEMLVNLIN